MARRKRRQEEHENHERWLVSYADFITLLFAFFVVMYSISSVNEGKYKILSESLDGVFNQTEKSMDPIQVGDMTRRFDARKQELIEVPDAEDVAIDTSKDGGSEDFEAQESRNLDNISTGIQEAFAELISDEQMQISGNEMWIEIEMSSSLLFEIGDSIPSNAAFDILKRIANIIKPFQNPMHVEGFTDNQAINSNRFPTNWELSTARSAAVVRMLASYGVDPRNMAAVGYGQFQPVARNVTAEGRARNRRVVLVISKNLDVRKALSPVGSETAKKHEAVIRNRLN